MIPPDRAHRSGAAGQGTITSIYTVLADGDDPNDPVDTARAILDGHILLSRQQAQMGIYPAIDVPMSERVMDEIADDKHTEAARMFRRLVSLYLENRDLILMGGYTPGQDPDLDMAVNLWPQLMELIRQNGAENPPSGPAATRSSRFSVADHGPGQKRISPFRAETEAGAGSQDEGGRHASGRAGAPRGCVTSLPKWPGRCPCPSVRPPSGTFVPQAGTAIGAAS